MSDEDGQGELCPDCGEYRGTNLGIQWARSKDCSYPVLSVTEEAILDGLMFVGGSAQLRGSRWSATPRVTKE